MFECVVYSIRLNVYDFLHQVIHVYAWELDGV